MVIALHKARGVVKGSKADKEERKWVILRLPQPRNVGGGVILATRA
jgi:hypothetical protein